MDNDLMRKACALSYSNVQNKKGGPFGAIIVKTDTKQIISQAVNTVTADKDPSCHAEVNAIRIASRILHTHNLQGHTLYTSCEPCPMCFGLIYWSHLDHVYYSNTREQAAEIGFDDAVIYQDINKPDSEKKIPFTQVSCDNSNDSFKLWQQVVSNDMKY